MRVGGTFGLRKHIVNTCTLQNCTHCTTCNYTSTWSSGFKQNVCTTVNSFLLMGNGTFMYGNFNECFFRIIHPFLDSLRYFTGFSKAIANYAITVSNYNECRETKGTTTFGHFRDTLYGHHLFGELNIAGFNALYVLVHCFCLEFETTFACPFCKCLHSSVIEIAVPVESYFSN